MITSIGEIFPDLKTLTGVEFVSPVFSVAAEHWVNIQINIKNPIKVICLQQKSSILWE